MRMFLSEFFVKQVRCAESTEANAANKRAEDLIVNLVLDNDGVKAFVTDTDIELFPLFKGLATRTGKKMPCFTSLSRMSYEQAMGILMIQKERPIPRIKESTASLLKYVLKNDSIKKRLEDAKQLDAYKEPKAERLNMLMDLFSEEEKEEFRQTRMDSIVFDLSENYDSPLYSFIVKQNNFAYIYHIELVKEKAGTHGVAFKEIIEGRKIACRIQAKNTREYHQKVKSVFIKALQTTPDQTSKIVLADYPKYFVFKKDEGNIVEITEEYAQNFFTKRGTRPLIDGEDRKNAFASQSFKDAYVFLDTEEKEALEMGQFSRVGSGKFLSKSGRLGTKKGATMAGLLKTQMEETEGTDTDTTETESETGDKSETPTTPGSFLDSEVFALVERRPSLIVTGVKEDVSVFDSFSTGAYMSDLSEEPEVDKAGNKYAGRYSVRRDSDSDGSTDSVGSTASTTKHRKRKTPGKHVSFAPKETGSSKMIVILAVAGGAVLLLIVLLIVLLKKYNKKSSKRRR